MEVQWSLEAAQQHRQARAYQWESAAARIHKTGDQQRYVYIIVYIYILKLVMQENLPRFTPHHKASLPFVLEPACLQVTANATRVGWSTDLARCGSHSTLPRDTALKLLKHQ